MNIFQALSLKLEEIEDELKHYIDPSCINEVLLRDKRFKNLDGWKQNYEEEDREQKETKSKSTKSKPQSQLAKDAKRIAQEQVLQSIGNKMKKKISQLMLETLSIGLNAASNSLIEGGQIPLGLMLDSLKGITLSFRFQNEFKYMTCEEKERTHILSSHFFENSKKMRYFRKVALDRFITYFNQERRLVEFKVIQRLKAQGMSNEKIQRLKYQDQLNLTSEEFQTFRQAIQEQMEKRARELVMAAINEKKQEALNKLHSSEIFQLRHLILSGNEIDPSQIELAENLVNSGLDKMIDLIFEVFNAQLDKVFAEVEKYLKILLQILNGVQIVSQTVADFNEQRKMITQLTLEDQKAFLLEQLQDQVEFAYSQFQRTLNNFVQGLVFMLQQMLNDDTN